MVVVCKVGVVVGGAVALLEPLPELTADAPPSCDVLVVTWAPYLSLLGGTDALLEPFPELAIVVPPLQSRAGAVLSSSCVAVAGDGLLVVVCGLPGPLSLEVSPSPCSSAVLSGSG